MKLIIYKRQMIFCVLVFIIFLPLSWAQFVVGSIYRTIALLTFAIYILIKKFHFIIPKENKMLLAAWTVYIFYCIFSAFWACNLPAAINNSLASLLLYFIVVIFLSSSTDIINRAIFDKCWLFVGVACFLLYLFGDRAQIGEYGSRTSLTILGTATDPNEFASIFIVPVAIATYYIIYAKKNTEKIFSLAIIIGSIYVIIMSGSRGGLFSVLLTLFITLLLYLRPSIKTFIGIIVCILIIATVFIYWILPNIPQDLLIRFSLDTLESDGGSGRSSLWKAALQKVWDGSVLRIISGYGQYGIFINGTGTMHNQLLQNLTNYGVIGLVLYIFLLVCSYSTISKRIPYYRGAFWGMMLMSMTITMSTAYKPLWIFLLTPAIFKEDSK